MVRILIADDHAVVRRGLRQILEETTDLQVKGEAKNTIELLDLLASEKWDVVILDLNMPGRTGFDVLKDIRRRWPKLPVLVLSMHDEEQFAARVIKAGAVGYMNKESAAEELVRAIRKVARGGKYISSRTAESLATEIQAKHADAPHTVLSDREFEVLCLIAGGKTVSAIAEELSLSVKTISTYRSRILEKMQMKTNAEVTRYAIKKGLVD